MSRRALMAVAIAALVAAGLGGWWIFRGTRRPPQQPIKIGYLNIVAGIPLLVAQNEGFFSERHLNVELVEFKTGNEVATAAVTGKIDVVGGAATNAILDASAESGVRFKIFVVNNYVRRPGRHASSDFLIAQPELTSIDQLRGKRVGIYPGSVGRVFAKLVFPRYGLGGHNVEFVELPPGQWQAALHAKHVAAITALEPFASAILESLNASVLIDGYYSEVMPRVPASGSWFIDGRLSRDTENRLFDAIDQGARLVARDRKAADSVLIDRMAVAPSVAPKVRLLEWTNTKDPRTTEQLLQYLDLLSKERVTRFKGEPSSWIWGI